MISRIPADVVRPGGPQKRPNHRIGDRTGSKTGSRCCSLGSWLSSELFPKEFLNFQFHEYSARARACTRADPCPKWPSSILSVWIFLSRASYRPRASGHIEKSPIPLKVERISRARRRFSFASRHSPERSARLHGGRREWPGRVVESVLITNSQSKS